ncbi:alkyl hydroperoxide reductase protein, peroxidase component [Campylobacter pinnipediorum subsp. caledonicus]|uniref:26 kDa antigen n=1 Tax=Campylobacter pinnipediorum subsp. caledonicus TaxID=1874362 RepID=A0A1S6U8V1_9BACT|nr:peroxiredoxin [Campylobacter pinnipediorum]AQW86522.1 alkyl hydroperoxide reductase protein, peroxidase component [Campylobacter pinnipediorum subsp. caledonicus]AQW88174.1 alkyl hydroperoxide reductase protein, peroxidase component [Campylobacter pinnipediorum subsp. caledonicus]OPA71610.1 peroxidase [Campylobacter pinnipediorum subsp. caledonicus]
MLVTKKAQDFTAAAVLGNNQIVEDFNLYKNIGEKGAVVFFYPMDFTFVCPSEIIAFDKRYDEFKSRGIEVIAVSTDNEFSHFAWKETPVNKGGIGQVRFPIVADRNHEISKAFDVLLEEAGIALRGSFLLDKDGTIRHAVVNDLPLGRNIDEMVRMVDTMIFTNEHGEVCPAGWNKGDAGMKPSTDGVADYLDKNANKL